MASKKHSYANDRIKVSYDGAICAHAGYCFRELRNVFDGDRDPPIDLNGAPLEEIIRVVEKCPSSALIYERLESEEQEQASQYAKAIIVPKGPIAIRGQIELGDRSYNRITLCRCGQSQNKPFCDGSHHQHSFDDKQYAEKESTDSPQSPSSIVVKPITDGPVILSGELSIQNTDGEELCRREKSGLCRCGASKNKPFCDGSHKEQGFQAP